MKKYEKDYQVVLEHCQNPKGEYEFTENTDDCYITLKGGGQIYRYNRNTLVLHLVYDIPIKSTTTLMKDPIKSVHKTLAKKFKLKDVYVFDDCVDFYFAEEDLVDILASLPKRLGTFSAKKKHAIDSVRWLPDYEERKSKFSEIKHQRSYDKIMREIENYAEKIKKNNMQAWRQLYRDLKLEFGVDVSEAASDFGVRPIHVIDDKNLYSKCFKIMGV